MAKPNYERRTFVDLPVRNPSSVVLVPNAALIPWPTLGFQITVRNATIKYHGVGDSQLHDANPSARIPLPPGEYEIVAEAPGFQKFIAQRTWVRKTLPFR